jgi:hypothetical protein
VGEERYESGKGGNTAALTETGNLESSAKSARMEDPVLAFFGALALKVRIEAALGCGANVATPKNEKAGHHGPAFQRYVLSQIGAVSPQRRAAPT